MTPPAHLVVLGVTVAVASVFVPSVSRRPAPNPAAAANSDVIVVNFQGNR